MFTRKYVYHYLFAVTLIGIASYFSDKIKQGLSSNDAENQLIRQYLLNESPLYGFNRPKLWIHSTYEKNARQWKDFYSRNSTDLNQPYIHLTIKSIINHCGNDFNICLIDDETFSRLIPTWEINMETVPEPARAMYRELGMMKLLYLYGGVVVPNSFLCLRSLAPLVADGSTFFAEEVNRTCNVVKKQENTCFLPGTRIMGAPKASPAIKDLVEFLEKRNSFPHFTQLGSLRENAQSATPLSFISADKVGVLNVQWGNSEHAFLGEVQQKILSISEATIIDGTLVGVKNNKKKPILLEDLLSENFLDLDEKAYGIYIPADQVLTRPKYQWFAYLTSAEVLATNAVITKYLKASAVDEYTKDMHTMKSVTTI